MVAPGGVRHDREAAEADAAVPGVSGRREAPRDAGFWPSLPRAGSSTAKSLQRRPAISRCSGCRHPLP
eukprot:15465776-Alexandrium_andersonii.AAC.1